MKACAASGLYTRSVVHLYTLCVYRYGAASRRPVFYPAFLKAGKCSRKGTFKRLGRREMPRSGSSETAFAVSCFEVCKTSKLPCTRSVPPRQGQTFCLSGSSRKGDGFILFASAKRTKKQPGLRPATSVQIAGRNGVLDKMTGFHQVTGCANHYFAQYRRQ